MKKIIITLSLIVASISLFAQGSPHVKVFSNFNYDIDADAENAFSEFEVKRAYLGYGYKLADGFTAKVTFDVGKNSAGSNYTAFLKIASLSWQASEKLNLSFGMIGSKNFKFMEKAWGKRYIYKSFQDQNKWASAADAGANLTYNLSDNLIIDAQLLNGEGYKNWVHSTYIDLSSYSGTAYIAFKYLGNSNVNFDGTYELDNIVINAK